MLYDQYDPYRFLSRNLHRAEVFLAKQSVLFLRYIVCVYRIAAAVNGNHVAHIWHIFGTKRGAQEGTAGVVMFCLTPYQFAKDIHTASEGFADPCKHPQVGGAHGIRQTHLSL